MRCDRVSELAREINRRRAFAIIAHPDAGKTTLTEKLLLYGGAIHLAGHVRAKRDRKATKSDFMALEQERGISVSTAALQFNYEGHVMNLLDTPGHQDFSEDTYRTLMAVDSAIMLLDASRGVEPQTIKLFKICRERNLPIITFINKMDMPALEAFELLGDALLLPKSDAAKAHKAYRNALEIIDVAAAKRSLAASEVRRRTLIAEKLRRIQ